MPQCDSLSCLLKCYSMSIFRISSFCRSFQYLASSWTPDPFVHMDETPMYFGMASNSTIEKKGTKSVSIRTTGAEKRHLTVVLAASADGSMLPQFVIFKGKRTLKNLSMPRGWVVTVQQKGWMDADLMKHWVQEIWLKHTSRSKALLVMDSFSAHCTEEIRDLLSRNNIALIPGGCTCTSKLQLLDVSLN